MKSKKVTRIGELHERFLMGGSPGFKLLSEDELRELRNYLRPLAEYMIDRGDRTMQFAIEREVEIITNYMRDCRITI